MRFVSTLLSVTVTIAIVVLCSPAARGQLGWTPPAVASPAWTNPQPGGTANQATDKAGSRHNPINLRPSHPPDHVLTIPIPRKHGHSDVRRHAVVAHPQSAGGLTASK
jgi:hypothetical protein